MQTVQKYTPLIERNLINILILVLLGILYLPLIAHWYDGWLNKSINIEHEYFSHGLIGIPYAIYIVWMQRKKWQKLENKAHPLGAFFLALAVIFYLTGVPQFVYFSLPIILTGLCLWLKGIPGLKLQWFPLLLILLATPNYIPYLLTPHTLWLQKFIASVAGFILMQFGFNVTVDQIYLSVDGQLVEVAPYCAGLKMLFTSFYVSLMLLHWTDNLKNKKIVFSLLGGAAVISVTANILRNTLLAMFHGTGQEDKFKWLHEGWGGDVYSVLMLLVIIILLKFLEKFNRKTEQMQPAEDQQVHE